MNAGCKTKVCQYISRTDTVMYVLMLCLVWCLQNCINPGFNFLNVIRDDRQYFNVTICTCTYLSLTI